MKKVRLRFLVIVIALMSLLGGATLLFSPGCGSSSDTGEPQGSGENTQSAPKIDNAPQNALFGQIYHDKKNKRKWIFDGAQWVPRDSSVDAYYAQTRVNQGTALKSMAINEVFSTCTASDATGAHTKHAGFNCKVCHLVGGVMCFDPAGPAYGTGTPPSFDATAKTCSNIACHGVKAGTYYYYGPGTEMDADGYPIPELKTAPYGGNIVGNTPSWYATNAGCTACHGNPPSYTNNYYYWHSGNHANSQNLGAGPGPNDCELCHNDPTKPYPNFVPIALSSGGHGYQINSAAAAQHANGTATVYAKFKIQCFACH